MKKKSGAQPNNKNNLKHGYTDTSTYHAWIDMRRRCENSFHPAFKWYGLRGVKVCARWSSFINFLKDMGEKPEGMSIDRINNNGDYTPENCRWTTAKEQAINRRNTIILFGLTVDEWCAVNNLKRSTIIERLRCGWNPVKAVTKKANYANRWL